MVDGNGWGGGWKGRKGDRDFDGRPGNSSESPQYARIYNRRSETETTNRLETATQIRLASLHHQASIREEEARHAALQAQSRVHTSAAIGKFIIPTENTWAAHAELIKDPAQNLGFNPERFVYFDKIIAETLDNPAITDPSHPDYMRYEGFRNNIAVLRNYVEGMYFDDGSYDPGDEIHLPKITGIATVLAEGLKNDGKVKRMFTRSMAMDVANVEAIGAREMYQYLLSRQTEPAGLFEGVRTRVDEMLGIPERTWGLKSLALTPFSPHNMSAPPPEQTVCYTAQELDAACAPEHSRMIEVSENTARWALNLRAPETLDHPAREASIEEAHKILRWLRNLQYGDMAVEEWMGRGTPGEELAKAEAVSRLVEIYVAQLHKATRNNPDVLEHITIRDANDAAGSLSLGMTMHAINALPSGHPGIARLDEVLDNTPQAWERRETQSIRQLLDTLEAGMQSSLGLPADSKSPADRLVESSRRLRRAARKFNSVDHMEPPAREESIELAREILRRLKNLRISDRPLDELVRTGTAAEQATFALKVDEMVETYGNLLAEAAQHNPGLLNDPKIKEASDAVGSFAYAVSLMAAKEIPVSLAASQQISADITQMPEEWKDLGNKTVDRLVQTMEGGLEKAVTDLEMQQQDQAQDQEVQQEQTQKELAFADSFHRRRRRKKRAAHGVAPNSAGKRVKAHDLNGDGIADHLQGLNLRGDQIAMVRELGGNLRAIGNEANELKDLQAQLNAANNPGMNVNPNDKIFPDDKPFAAREREQRTPTQRPRDRV